MPSSKFIYLLVEGSLYEYDGCHVVSSTKLVKIDRWVKKNRPLHVRCKNEFPFCSGDVRFENTKWDSPQRTWLKVYLIEYID